MANALLAAILSFFIPGLGQFYCGSLLRGLLIFIGALIVFAIAIFIPIIGAIIAFVYWIANIVDAFALAQKR
ncbi:MAG: hypothetical protein LBE57_01185 [Methanosarcinales archaeon]|jgi:TM2 domain-containing membrane protein YozV|nr:hypothetical protein [Methanosarcinales archaeon]